MTALEDRVTALEQGFAEVLDGMPRDELALIHARQRAHTQALNALRETQIEQGRDISVLKGDVAGLKGDVGELKLGQHTIIAMLTTLIEQDADAPPE